MNYHYTNDNRTSLALELWFIPYRHACRQWYRESRSMNEGVSGGVLQWSGCWKLNGKGSSSVALLPGFPTVHFHTTCSMHTVRTGWWKGLGTRYIVSSEAISGLALKIDIPSERESTSVWRRPFTSSPQSGRLSYTGVPSHTSITQ